MTQVDDIRNAFFTKGLNISDIARKFQTDRKTVRKYVTKEDWNIDVECKTDSECFPKLEPFKKIIDQWLEEDKKARRKQRHTAKRVFDRLCEEYNDEFNCSYRTVAGYVAQRKKQIFQNNSCRLPLIHSAGEAQVDFGKADFYENGTHFEGAYLNISFPHSNGGYVQLFKGENQECLFEGLTSIFEHLGGVPYKIWFDNASTLVTSIHSGGHRSLTDGFLRFKQHYGFEAVFCNPNAGHEKGSVEAKVGYHRRNLLVPVPRFEKLEDFNQELLLLCDQDMKREHYRKESPISDLFEEDKKAFLPLPTNLFEASHYITVHTNNYAQFSLNGGKHIYSTAPKYAKSKVLVKVTAHEVIPLDENRRDITRHRRLYGSNKQESMNWLPYLTQLARSPRALKYSGVHKMLPEPLQEYLEGCSNKEQGQALRAVAALCSKSTFEQAIEAVAEALRHGAKDLDSLIALHSRISGITPPMGPLKQTEEIPKVPTFRFEASKYDEAFLKGDVRAC